MQWNKDVIVKILRYILTGLSFSEIDLFFSQKVKIFRHLAIYELLRRCKWSDESSDYLIKLLSYHLSEKSILSLQLPKPLLEQCLQDPFIDPKLAIVIHGCLGCLDGQLTKASRCFLGVVSHLTLEGLPYIYLARVSANPVTVNDKFKKCLTLTDIKVQLESLLLISNYLNNVQRRRVISLLTPDLIVNIQSRQIFHVALYLINNDTFSAVVKLLISSNYVAHSPRRNKCGIGFYPESPPLKFAASVWNRLQADQRNMMFDRLIAMLYQNNRIDFAYDELSSLSYMLEREYCVKLCNEISNYNLIFPIKSRGTGRSATACTMLFRKILPNIWKNLDDHQRDKSINLVLYLIQTSYFHNKKIVQSSVNYFLDVLLEKQISYLFIKIIRLVQEYNSDDVSTNFDDIMRGVAIVLDLLQRRLNADDINVLNKVLSEWLSSESIKHKILAARILHNCIDVFSENHQIMLINLLLENLKHDDEEVFLYSSLCLVNACREKLESRFVLRCIDIFTRKYNKYDPQYSLLKVLENFRVLFLRLNPNERVIYLSKLIDNWWLYDINKATIYTVLSNILDLVGPALLEKIEKNILFEVNKDTRHSGFGSNDGFNELLEKMSFLKSVREALVAIYNKSPLNIKYLSTGFQGKIVQWGPVKIIQSPFDKIIKNNDARNCHYLRNNNEFRFFSNRWQEMPQESQRKTIRNINKNLGRHHDYSDLAVIMMLWPKISESEKDAMDSVLAKRFLTTAKPSRK